MIEFFENKDMDITCPVCKKFMTKADRKDYRIHKLKCKSCGLWIWFKPSNSYRRVKRVPERQTSSGMRFY